MSNDRLDGARRAGVRFASPAAPSPESERRAVGLNRLAERCHGAASGAGWWPEVRDVRVFATAIALIHSEASEMLEGLRKGIKDDHLPHRQMEEVEAADLLIRIFDYAGARGLDLDGAFEEKLAYNARRADHKPEARKAAGGKTI